MLPQPSPNHQAMMRAGSTLIVSTASGHQLHFTKSPSKTSTMSKSDEMSGLARLSATVYGRVQGVYFRYFVRTEARELGLKGYVRNLATGDAVEVQAEGEKDRLDKLVEQLKVGPPGARVKRVETDWSGCSGQFTDFSIRY
jgi:acylphosphatase